MRRWFVPTANAKATTLSRGGWSVIENEDFTNGVDRLTKANADWTAKSDLDRLVGGPELSLDLSKPLGAEGVGMDSVGHAYQKQWCLSLVCLKSVYF